MDWLFWGWLASQAAAEDERRQRALERKMWGKDEWDDDEDDWDDLEDELEDLDDELDDDIDEWDDDADDWDGDEY